MAATSESPASLQQMLVESKRKANRYRRKMAFLEREVLIAEKERLEKRLRELGSNLTNLRTLLVDKRNDRNTGCDDAAAAEQQRKQRENERKRAEIEEQKKRKKVEDELKVRQDQEKKERIAQRKEDTKKRVEVKALRKRNKELKIKEELEKAEAAAKKAEEERNLAAIAALKKKNEELEKKIQERKELELKEAAEKKKEEDERKKAEKKRIADEAQKERDEEAQKYRDEEARKNKGEGGSKTKSPENKEGEGDRAGPQGSLLPRHFSNLDKKSCNVNCAMHCLLSSDELRHNLRRFVADDIKALHNLALDFEAKKSPYRYDVIPLRMVMGGEFIKDQEDDTIKFLEALAERSRKVREQIQFETIDHVKCGGKDDQGRPVKGQYLTLKPYRYIADNKGCTAVSIQHLIEHELNFNVGAPDKKCTVCLKRKEVTVLSNIIVLNISMNIQENMKAAANPFAKLTMDITGIADGTAITIGGASYRPIAGVFYHPEIGTYYCYIKNGSSWTVADDQKPTTTIKDWPKPCKNLSLLCLEKVRDPKDKAPVTPAPTLKQKKKEGTIRRLAKREPRSCPGTYFDNRTPPEQFVVTDALQSVINIDRGIHLKWDADVFHDIVLPADTLSEFIRLAREVGDAFTEAQKLLPVKKVVQSRIKHNRPPLVKEDTGEKADKKPVKAVQKKGAEEVTPPGTEFVGKLFGYPLSCIGVMVVTHLMIPNQTKHLLRTSQKSFRNKSGWETGSDIWSVDDELDAQAGAGLGDVMQVGWIRAKTKRKVNALMAPRDLHRQAHYQKIQKDAIGIICTDLDKEEPSATSYTLTEAGMKKILECSGLTVYHRDDLKNNFLSRAELHAHQDATKLATNWAFSKDENSTIEIVDLRPKPSPKKSKTTESEPGTP